MKSPQAHRRRSVKDTRQEEARVAGVDRLVNCRTRFLTCSLAARRISHIGQDGAIAYANKRAEMRGAMRAWLASGMIPDDRDCWLTSPVSSTAMFYAGGVGRCATSAFCHERTEASRRRASIRSPHFSPDSNDRSKLIEPEPD